MDLTSSCSQSIHGNWVGDRPTLTSETTCGLKLYITPSFFFYRVASFYYPPGETGNELGKSDPVFMRKYGDALKEDSGKWIDSHVWHGKPHTWEKIPWLIKEVRCIFFLIWQRAAKHRTNSVEAHFKWTSVRHQGNSMRRGCAEGP